MFPSRIFEKPIIVVSGINMIEGGILTILKDCLNFLDENLARDYSIVALVHDKNLFSANNIHYVEFKPKANWFKRLYYEYYYFKKISNILKPQLWFSLHDITPKVEAEVQAVYCHNAMMFYRPSLSTLFLDPKQVVFAWFYKYLYKINIRSNRYVVVQQNWMKKEFNKIFSINNVITAYPESDKTQYKKEEDSTGIIAIERNTKEPFRFFYPSYPRVFKNFELLCEAARILYDSGYSNLEVIITMSGDDNKYSKSIFKKYKHIPIIKWVGLLSLKEVYKQYEMADALVFPSKLETWGLPISEFKAFNKPILVADLPYAHESTTGHYSTTFFNPDDANQLAECMVNTMKGTAEYSNQTWMTEDIYYGWRQLFDKLLNSKQL